MDLQSAAARIPCVRLATILLTALVLAPVAAAGGSHVDVAVHDRTVFVAGDADLRALDALTGRTLWAPPAASSRYDLSVDVAAGAVWVASVANGFVDGRLTRIDLRDHAARDVLRVPDGSVLYVAHGGGGGVYALVGRGGRTGIVRLSGEGRVTGRWPAPGAGRIAADRSGCWISATGRLLHLDASGRLRVAAHVGFGDVAAGGGAVWVAGRDELVRVDERSGRVRRIRTSPLGLGGFQHDVAVGAGFLWTLGTGTLERRDPTTGRLLAAVRVPRIADAVAVADGAVWVATTQGLRRLDPRTLRVTLRLAP